MTPDPISIEPRAPDSATAEGRIPLQAVAGEASLSRNRLHWILPLVALASSVAVYALLVATRDHPETQDAVVPVPLVRVMIAESETLQLSVSTHGTVTPRTESDLVAEVRGRVLEMSDALVVGGYFAQGEPLLRLDDREHRIALDRARAMVSLRESEARLASADAGRRRKLEREGASSAADLEQFESRESVARAFLAEARATLEQAELDLERTVVRAPYDGRVRERNVDVGQFVSPGSKLGRIFAVDQAEIRLPIQMDDLAFLDVELDGPIPAPAAGVDPAGVELSARLGGIKERWPARLVRAEAVIDSESRMLHVVAQVDDPYRLRSISGGDDETKRAVVPLPAGLFVTAEIQGRTIEDVFVVPTMALRDGDRLFVQEVTQDDGRSDLGLLRVREVSVVRRDRDRVVIDGGLARGDRIVISPLRIYSEGMAIRTVEADAP